ncbi:MAG: hypothetical protein V1901_03765 [Patescibacteria group bacterium]
MITLVNAKSFENEMLFSEINDVYESFYITIDNERKFFKDVKIIRKYASLLNRGELCFKDENKGFLITYGLNDKLQRKYIKLLVKNNYTARRLLTVFLYNHGNIEWYIKIKKYDPLLNVLLNKIIGFKSFFPPRGNEILLVRPKMQLNKLVDKEEIKKLGR